MMTRVCASSAPNGSSSSSTFGPVASARTMPTRCFMPPDRLSGYLFSNAVRPASPSSVRAARSRLDLSRCFIFRPNSTLLLHGLPGKQRILLEHHAAIGAGTVDRLAIDGDAAPWSA